MAGPLAEPHRPASRRAVLSAQGPHRRDPRPLPAPEERARHDRGRRQRHGVAGEQPRGRDRRAQQRDHQGAGPRGQPQRPARPPGQACREALDAGRHHRELQDLERWWSPRAACTWCRASTTSPLHSKPILPTRGTRASCGTTPAGRPSFRGGTLASLVELRDGDTRGEIQALDLLTVNFTDMVNEVHRRGFGLDGGTGVDFFVEQPFVLDVTGNYDANGDGAFDSTYVFRVTGANSLRPKDLLGLAGTLTLPGQHGPVQVEYQPTDTVEDLLTRHQPGGIRDRGAAGLGGETVAARHARRGQREPRLRDPRPGGLGPVPRGLQRHPARLGTRGRLCLGPGRRGRRPAPGRHPVLRGPRRSPRGVDRGEPEAHRPTRARSRQPRGWRAARRASGTAPRRSRWLSFARSRWQSALPRPWTVSSPTGSP